MHASTQLAHFLCTANTHAAQAAGTTTGQRHCSSGDGHVRPGCQSGRRLCEGKCRWITKLNRRKEVKNTPCPHFARLNEHVVADLGRGSGRGSGCVPTTHRRAYSTHLDAHDHPRARLRDPWVAQRHPVGEGGRGGLSGEGGDWRSQLHLQTPGAPPMVSISEVGNTGGPLCPPTRSRKRLHPPSAPARWACAGVEGTVNDRHPPLHSTPKRGSLAHAGRYVCGAARS